MNKAKTVLITGAARGIGAETARQFARAGYNVVVNYNTGADAAKKLSEEINTGGRGCCVIFKCDVADTAAVKDMAGWTIKNFGGADVLINNAGLSAWGLFQDTMETERRKIIDVNLHGIFNVTHAFLPCMLEKRSGCIINISSIWGVSGASCEAVYSASKAAAIGFTKALARETGPSGVRVNCIAPGMIDTGMSSRFSKTEIDGFAAQTALNKIGKPSDVAAAALYLAGAEYVTGQVLVVDGGFITDL